MAQRVVLTLVAVMGTVALLASVAGASGVASSRPQLRVGYVASAGDEPDRRALFGLPYDGFIRAVKAFKVQGRVLQVAPNQLPTGALSLLARQRYDLVVMGVPAPPAVDPVAREFPRTKFLLPDDSFGTLPGRPKNVQGTHFRAEEAAYLAGYLAGLMEKRRPGRDVIGSVGGYKIPGVDRWILPFQAGARKADPGIVTLNTYTDNFLDPAKCRTAALDQIAKGAGVVFDVAGACGLGALAAAKEKGVWGVGVDIDQSFLGPHILTSAVLAFDVGVFRAIGRLVAGKFTTGGDTLYDLRNGGVGLGRISPAVPASFLHDLAKVRRAIVAGKIRVPLVT
jgi:basic membrane protein A